ncbi:hypothetical protein Sjap_005781 [Stephania japonica]|uniref:Uncharacterized protein n=1 Tax=Stephania japonica TaxID=461633 RepID=A0AAP0K692_9MAGN
MLSSLFNLVSTFDTSKERKESIYDPLSWASDVQNQIREKRKNRDPIRTMRYSTMLQGIKWTEIRSIGNQTCFFPGGTCSSKRLSI